MDNKVNISKRQDTVKALKPKVQQLQEGKIMQGSTKKFEYIEQKEDLFKFLALQISQSQNLEEIFNTTVTELGQLLKNERVIIYHFNFDVGGKVVAESVVEAQWSILGKTVLDRYFEENLIADYQQGRIQTFGDLQTAGLSACHTKFLANLQLKANLVVPILLENNQLLETDKKQNDFSPDLWGLLIAQNCSSPRNWQSDEIELLKELSTYLSLAIRQDLFEKKLAAEQSEKRRLETELKAVKQKLDVKKVIIIPSQKYLKIAP
ncbi:MAG: GAF domain-containing protein [Cyanobacteria bacterium P01_H01_bin.35]